MPQFNRFAALSGMAAALAMAATPAAAAKLPAATPLAKPAIAVPAVLDEDMLKAERHRRWRYRGYRHRHGIDAGDVLAGVLIIGGIAAIANAGKNSERDRRYRERDYRDERADYRERRDTRRSGSGRGIDGAVDMCLSEIERDVRVDRVDSVERSGEGWRVTGTIYNGDGFSCTIDEDGRIESVDYGGGFAAADPSDASPVVGNQHSDARYRAAWAQVDRDGAGPAASPATGAEQLPAYPGGPIDGDLEAGSDDEPYRMAQAPAK